MLKAIAISNELTGDQLEASDNIVATVILDLFSEFVCERNGCRGKGMLLPV